VVAENMPPNSDSVPLIGNYKAISYGHFNITFIYLFVKINKSFVLFWLNVCYIIGNGQHGIYGEHLPTR
jgi:hypothetical protein